jgi:hypothetical protein
MRQPNIWAPLEEYGCLVPGQRGVHVHTNSLLRSTIIAKLQTHILLLLSHYPAVIGHFHDCSPISISSDHYTGNMVHSISPAKTREEHRWLRVTTVLAFLPAFALLLPYGIITARPLPTVGIAPMFFSTAFSTLVLGGGVRSPGMRACLDLLLATSILAVLVPRYFEDGHSVNGCHGMID